MKPALQLRLSQSLKMTPQLQQAIRLLQLSTLELQTEIQQMLEANPMLDEDEQNELPIDTGFGPEDNREKPGDAEAAVERMPGEEDSWDHSFTSVPSNPASAPAPDQTRDIPDLIGDDLRDHLLWQLNLSHLSVRDARIAGALIDSLDESGYLTGPMDDIFAALDDLGPEPEEVEAVRHQIQHCDPLGCASVSLSECLTVQLKELAAETEGRDLAIQLAEGHLDRLARREFDGLAATLGASAELIKQAARLIQTMEPRPGALVPSGGPQYIIPDVYVRKIAGKWQLALNETSASRLRVNEVYRRMISSAKAEDASYMRAQLQEARWFIRSLETRNHTVLRVAETIVERQLEFFERGPEAMQPMVLRDVAEQLELHESTISRVTRGKYLHCSKGVFEFKFFFSSHVTTNDGGAASATAIRAKIKRLISEEPPRRPLSDAAIAKELNNRGIHIARRTVAKYREAMNIPSSSDRKHKL